MLSPTGCFCLLLVAYLATASRWVLGGDNGEFVTLFAEGGVAHPSGYPVYTLYLRALHPVLSVFSPALGASIATTLVAAAAIAALYRACRAFRAGPDAALFAAGLFAVSPLCWSLATHAEVFAPNALFAALLVLLGAPEALWQSPTQSHRRAALLGLVAGLALANHLSIVLLAPIGLVAIGLTLSQSPKAWYSLALFALGLALGLSPYLSLPIQALASNHWVWGDPSTLSGFFRHCLRADYGISSLSSGHGPALPVASLKAFVPAFFSQWLFAPALLGAFCLIRDIRDSLRSTPRDGALPKLQLGALALSLALAGPVFISRFNIAPVGLGAIIVSRFYLLPMVLFTPFVARGADLLATRLRPRVWRTAITLMVLTSALRTLPALIDEHRPTLDHYATDLLALCPRDAIVLASGDHRFFGLIYAQRALRVRRDVTVIAPTILLVDPNRERYSRALGVTLAPPSTRGTPARRVINMPEVLTRLLSTHRPVLVTDEIAPGLLSHFSTYPIGPLIRVLPQGFALPRPEALEDMNLRALAHSHLRAADFTDEGWFSLVYTDWARPWSALSLAYENTGNSESARRCRQREGFILGRLH